MEIIALTIGRKLLRILLKIAAILGIILIQMNIVEVYLKSKLVQNE